MKADHPAPRREQARAKRQSNVGCAWQVDDTSIKVQALARALPSEQAG